MNERPRGRGFRADFTGDGLPDLAIVGSNTQSLVVAIIIGPINGGSKIALLSWPIGEPWGVAAACAAKASVAVEDVALPAYLEDSKPREARAKGLRLEIRPCDVFHLYWNADSHWAGLVETTMRAWPGHSDPPTEAERYGSGRNDCMRPAACAVVSGKAAGRLVKEN
jgi:hypothetical protein